MRPPTLRQLRTFLAVVDTGSVSEAARSLGLTQPAASQQLRELERSLAVRLLDRAAGKIIPTPAGMALVEPARRVQAAADDAVAATTEYKLGDVGRVRIGTGSTACIYLLPAVLAAVKRAMPGLTVTVAIGNTAELLLRLEAGDLDVGLVAMPAVLSRGLSATPLFVDPLVALLPEALAGDGKTVTAIEMNAVPLILYEAGGQTRSVTDAWFRQACTRPQPIMELGSVEAIKVLVAAGLGAAVLPQMALPTKLPGTVTRELEPAMVRSLGYVLRREKTMDRGLRTLIVGLERVAASRV